MKEETQNKVIIVALVLLIVVAGGQVLQLSEMSGGSATWSAGAEPQEDGSGQVPSPSEIEDLPDMVGGC